MLQARSARAENPPADSGRELARAGQLARLPIITACMLLSQYCYAIALQYYYDYYHHHCVYYYYYYHYCYCYYSAGQAAAAAAVPSGAVPAAHPDEGRVYRLCGFVCSTVWKTLISVD